MQYVGFPFLLVVSILAHCFFVDDQQSTAVHAFSFSSSSSRIGRCQHSTRTRTTTSTTHVESIATTRRQQRTNRLHSTRTTEGGTGTTTPTVDRDQYNLPIEQIAEEWTAVVVPESSLRETGIYLGAKSSDTIMVDTIPIVLTRQREKGLGLELLEIAGGRSDGLGIVVINGIVNDGIADGSNIMIGDSIAAITVVRKVAVQDDSTGSLSEQEERESIECECFGYDKLVDAIVNLPSIVGDKERIILTIKRLRRKPKVSIRLQYPPSQNEPDITLELFSGENLRRAMLTRGVKLNDPLSQRFDSGGMGDCGAEGTCATCVVNIVEGGGLLNPQKIQEAQILAKNPRWRLACRAIVGYGDQEGTMTVRINPRQWDDYQPASRTTLQ